MKRISRFNGVALIIAGVLLIAMAITQMAVAAPGANTGVTGRVVDAKTVNPWVYGGEVVVIQTTGTNIGLKGSTFLASDGTFTVVYNSTDDLNLCGNGIGQMGPCSTADNFANIQILIAFTCDLNTGNGTRPNSASSNDANCPLTVGGIPLSSLPNNMEYQLTDTFISGIRNVGDIDTNRGPTAVTLETISISNNEQFLVLIVVGTILIALGTFLTVRRRRFQV
ncbi:MAG: hypothetical protein ACE5E7_08840 [Anaerolineae bacterium]